MKTSQPTTEPRKRKVKKFKRYMQAKLVFSFGMVTLALLVLVLVIIRIIGTKGEDYSKTVLTQQNYNSTVLPFKRGTILDRNQTVLAASEQVYNLILDPAVIYQGNDGDINAALDALVQIFGYSKEELQSVLAEHKESSYVRYARQLPADQKTAFETYESENNANKNREGTIRGIWFESEYKRVYPYDTLACTALGFSGADSSQGNWGIEQFYNQYLIGTNGREYGFMSNDGVVERTTKEAKDGNTIVTTLDYTIQKEVESAIAEYCETTDVENVGVLVMDPNTAEILAMASDSVYDLNNPADLSRYYSEDQIEKMTDEETSDVLNQMWRNFVISDTFEPGSTAKAFTEAAALEENLAEETDTFVCDGGQQVADRYIRCSHNHGTIDFTQALGYSCNDAMMQMAKSMGKHIFSSYQNRFGLGYPTGLDLPGEASGLLYSEESMSSVDLATNAFGQNFTATMVQMAAAYCSILNGGSYYQPHIVKEIISPEGQVVEQVGNTVVRETISQATSEVLRAGLRLAVEDETGTGIKARIEGYTVGGKTGTAEKYPRGEEKYVLSFIGFTPVENPELLVYVVIDNPSRDGEQLTSASEAVILEQKIMTALLDYRHVTPAVRSSADPEESEAGETTPAIPETDEHGETIAPTAETDEDGNPVEQEDPEEEENRQGPWEDEVPEGGFMDEDNGPPAGQNAGASGQEADSGDENE